jgi:hypothetical protein
LIGVLLLIAAAPVARAEIITYDFRALIDGRDQLHIKGNTLQWHHIMHAAVGRHGGNNFPTTIWSTLDGVVQMDGVEWIPEWPDPPPNEIRYEAWSSVFSDLTPPSPMTDMVVTLRIKDARQSLSILQHPTADNEYTTILDFSDTSQPGSAWYEGGVAIEYTAVPEPACLTLWLLAGGCGLLYMWRKRRTD